MRSSNSKTAFTLVELLVVIAIIGTLMGLLLPAVQSAREAGRRNTCSNNVSQLGKAVVAFDGQRGFIPGWRNANVSGTLSKVLANTTAPLYAWPVLLLPSLERRDIFNVAVNNTTNPGSLITATGTVTPYLEIFNCPSSPSSNTSEPTIAYAGNSGFIQSTQNVSDGVMGNTIAKKIGLDFVGAGDGTSNTLLFAEKSSVDDPTARWSNPQTSFFSGPSGGFNDSPGWTPGFVVNGAVTLNASTPAVAKVINSGTASQSRWPSSNHPGGVVVAFCDGHTMFLRDTVSADVYAQLITSKSETATLGSTDTPNLRFLGTLDESTYK
jgi:prepilin-type N-terminal cleavage/methylation domain-containing protein/prepilin-type processing-associated H-X9-DG protein